jgi:predicted NBD/HSP70 family sugar kinase
VAGIDATGDLPLPDKLKLVQSRMAAGDYRARKIYETLGTYLGYGIAHFADFYDLQHVLVLGRVTSGTGGDIIVRGARAVLDEEFPALAGQIRIHVPDETEKRHGQAIAAASLPALVASA